MAGEILKQRREELGRDIREIADLLKIKADYLIAIESDSFDKLPAPVYTMGYIRCYAAYLQVEADAIVEFYTRNLTQPTPSTIIPIGYSQKRGPGKFYIVGGLLALCVVGYVLLPYFRGGTADKTPAPTVQPIPSPSVRVAPVPAPSLNEAALPAPAMASMPSATEHRLNVSADAKVWMMLAFADGRREEMLMRPGEAKSWDFSGQVTMKTGNAGGLRLNLDGMDLPPAGAAGEVKTIILPAQ